ncbi:MAG: HAD hydrolase-like protein [Dehalococcoidia bacterium]|jgi:putative hydrolase of the HAD superfamily|nr:HAD hydrolase-like protein [Dehalococcoidia bacterium]
MTRAVLFDLFGTLVPSPPANGYRDVVDSIAGIAGLPPEEFFYRWMSVNDDRLKGTFGSSEGEIGHVMDLSGITLSNGQLAECVRIRRAAMGPWLEPKPGCFETLQQLSDDGIALGLVSDCVFDVPAVWPSTPFAGLFSTTVFSCVEGRRKPDARLYEKAMADLGIRPAESIFVGDGGSNELQGARDLGISAYFLDDQAQDLSTVMRVDVHEWDGPSIKSLSEVPGLIYRTGHS